MEARDAEGVHPRCAQPGKGGFLQHPENRFKVEVHECNHLCLFWKSSSDSHWTALRKFSLSGAGGCRERSLNVNSSAKELVFPSGLDSRTHRYTSCSPLWSPANFSAKASNRLVHHSSVGGSSGELEEAQRCFPGKALPRLIKNCGS